MKLTLAIVLGVCALFAVQPAMAADETVVANNASAVAADDNFHALGTLTVDTEMTDAELAAVEGGQLDLGGILTEIVGAIPLGFPPIGLPGLTVPSLPAL